MIKGLFRQAAKALTREDEPDALPAEKRRKGETEGEFQRFARRFAGRLDVRACFKGRAAILKRDIVPDDEFAAAHYLQTTFDQLSAMNEDYGFIEEYSGSFDGPQHTLSLDL